MNGYRLIYEGLLYKKIHPIKKFLIREKVFIHELNPSGIQEWSLLDRLTNPKFRREITVLDALYLYPELTIYFNATPTPPKKHVLVLTPSIRQYYGTFYNIVFKFPEASTYLGDKETFLKKSQKEKEELILEVIVNTPVQLYSNAPDWYYQSGWERAEELGASAIPFPGPKGTGLWQSRHQAAGGMGVHQLPITKHMTQIIRNFDQYISDIARKVR